MALTNWVNFRRQQQQRHEARTSKLQKQLNLRFNLFFKHWSAFPTFSRTIFSHPRRINWLWTALFFRRRMAARNAVSEASVECEAPSSAWRVWRQNVAGVQSDAQAINFDWSEKTNLNSRARYSLSLSLTHPQTRAHTHTHTHSLPLLSYSSPPPPSSPTQQLQRESYKTIFFQAQNGEQTSQKKPVCFYNEPH